MRVWIVDNTPDYEQATRVGVYSSPVVAWDDMFKEIDAHVFQSRDEFMVKLTADTQLGELADIAIEVHYNSGDTITLTGVYVTGTGNPMPTLADWRDLQQVGVLIMRHAVEQAGFVNASEFRDERGPVGQWRLRKETD